MTDQTVDRLRSIKTFPSLVKYLRDELDWPIESDKFDDLTFDYQPEELGLDAKTAVKIKEIKQLRPLASKQPWGIFFINFEPKNLPVVALRRILSHLVIKKRRSANNPQQAAWQAHDLLFISSYGEEEHRDITFAQFSEDANSAGDLPSLRVLSWDNEDTAAHLEHAHEILKDKLRWPEDPSNLNVWRNTWSAAFAMQHREVVNTSKALAIRMAELATTIRKRVNKILEVESEKGPLRTLHASFKEALIHDLKADDFADMYAQTITYGLLSARVSRPAGLVADNIADMVPLTNPFLRDLLSTFLTVGGRKGKINFDEVGINEVVQVLRDANMEAVLRDFGDKNPQEDPVVHFYELFLKEYDPKKRMQRGVFYTPRPIVSYIVRSVDEILRKEFGLADGLADTATWGQMVKNHPEIKIPEGAKSNDPFVQILDPATGTGTFLVEVIDVIHKTMTTKWNADGKNTEEIKRKWNEYVPDQLLPRLYGFELMMAPYAVAHMKIGLKLHDTGYDFQSHERARIYLTNALEPTQGFSGQLELDAPALAHEAQAVNEVKANKRFTVVIGNPPYSRVSQNQSDFIQKLLKYYKGPVEDEANQQPLDDDYIKFLRVAHYLQSTAKCGIIGFITNHTVISGILFRGVRQRLLEDQNFIAILDLHGNSNIKEKCPDGSKDENVFDIQAGVAVTIGVKAPWLGITQCVFHELLGLRKTKYANLQRLSVAEVCRSFAPTAPYFFLKPIDLSSGDELKGAFSLPEIFPSYSSGLMTVRDNLAIAFDRDELNRRFEMFRSSNVSDTQFQSVYPVKDYRNWNMSEARRKVRADKQWEKRMRVVNYRPFDKRWIFYSSDIITYPNFRVMDQFKQKNLGLTSSRIHKGEEHAHEFATREMVEIIFLSSKSSNNAFLFPLYIFDAEGDLALRTGGLPNFSREFLKQIADNLNLHQQSGSGLPQGLTPEDIFHYAYAALHSPAYRSRYAEFLKFEFPRLPITKNVELFRTLARLGGELVALHLLESPKLDKPLTEFIGGKNSEIEKISWTNKTVWINKAQTIGFQGVPEAVWNFHIGGYQVCEKYLKDRKGRMLSKEDIAHYQKIVVALSETIRLMKEIDEVIEKHGGWPGAFQTP